MTRIMQQSLPIGGDESVSNAVSRAVSEVKNCPIESIPPFCETVNPDALDNLCASQFDGRYIRYRSVVTARVRPVTGEDSVVRY